jgi:predicted dehydrogenase
VIGLGVYGQIHARVYAAMAGIELVAVCDANGERADATAAELGCVAFTDYQEMLADPRIGAVSVALPDFAHRDAALAVLTAGKHALVEKPLATEPDECLELIRAAADNGVDLMTDFAQRWSPYVQQAKRSVSDGLLVPVQFGYYRASDALSVPTSMLSWAGRSSVAWFLSSHCWDNLLWIFGARAAYEGTGPGDTVERIHTIRRDRVLAAMDIPTADFYLTTIEWSSGMVTQLENAWILPNSGPSIVDLKMEFVGASGSLLVDGSHHRMIELQTDRAEYLDPVAALDVFGEPAGFAAESIRHFATSVARGVRPRVDGVDGLAVTRLVHAMEQSAARREPVDIDWNPFAVTERIGAG